MYVEALELILRALQSAGQDISFKGRYYNFDSVPIVMAPLQKPYPPLWYGVARPDSVTWAAAHAVNIVGNAAVETMRAITDRYRAEWLGDPASLPRMGTSRHIVVADTDAEALDIARRAYRVWFASFMNLWDKCGGIPPNARFPDEFDGVVRLGKGDRRVAANRTRHAGGTGGGHRRQLPALPLRVRRPDAGGGAALRRPVRPGKSCRNSACPSAGAA